MSELHGKIVIEKLKQSKRVSWSIELGINNERDDAVLTSGWGYMTKVSAMVSAKEWAKRLNIELDK